MAKELSDKAKNFCRIYATNGFHIRRAYMEAYQQKDEKMASIAANTLLKDKRVRDLIDEEIGSFKQVGLKEGMTKEAIVKVLFQMMNATKKDAKGNDTPDWTARNAAITTFHKLTAEPAEGEKHKRPEEKTDAADDAAEVKDLSKLEGDELIRERKRILERMTFDK